MLICASSCPLRLDAWSSLEGAVNVNSGSREDSPFRGIITTSFPLTTGWERFDGKPSGRIYQDTLKL